MCDKATYVTMNKVFCVNIRFLKNDTYELITRFYRLIPVNDDSAEGLFELLKTTLEEYGIGWNKVVGYASAGENLMQEFCVNQVKGRHTRFICCEMFLSHIPFICMPSS